MCQMVNKSNVKMIIMMIMIIITIIIIIIIIIIASHERKEVCTIEMSCPWIESRAKKDEEKTLKYGPMMWELKQRYNGYRVEQYNVIIDVLGGYSKHLEKSVRKLLETRARSVLEWMQKSVISNTLNIARTFR